MAKYRFAKKIQVIDRLEYKEPDLIVSLLKKEGLGVTPARVAVLSAFYIDDRSELNATDIYLLLYKQRARLSLSTIYSVIYFLCTSGILRVSAVVNGTKFYEYNYDRYPMQLICSQCGHKQKIVSDELIEYCKIEVEKAGFEPGRFTLFINGYCNRCH